MKPYENVIEVLKDMEGIEGIPTEKEFLNEFIFRLKAEFKRNCSHENKMVNADWTCLRCDLCGKKFKTTT